MKHLKNFFQLNESQSKKIKKVLTFSVILDWYNDNKDKIASIIGCQPEDLATQDELLDQSRGLVNHVINSQVQGNTGNDTTEIAGFSNFTPFDQYLIHDILHNIYDVSKKDFMKNITDMAFSESEIFEEIEVLCIEESFMKFCNIRYPKTDFINQNINYLASFLMMTILKNDPTRIKDILDKKIDPYLEIFGVKYEIEKGSPFESLFSTLTTKFRDIPQIDDSEDFKNYMIKLINISEGIKKSSGDRSKYPRGNYYGSKPFEDATNSDLSNLINELGNNSVFRVISSDEEIDIPYLNTLEIELSSNQNYIEDIDYDNLEELKLPFKKQFLNSNGYINVEEWFKYLSLLSKKEFYKIGDITYLVIRFDDEEYTYCIEDKEDVQIYLAEDWFNQDGDILEYESEHEFIDIEHYKKLSFEQVSKTLFNNAHAVAIMRRNFRDNDIITNNTKLGNLYTLYWRQSEVNLQKDQNFIDFKSKRENKKSISKNILTNNGKKLISVLNSIRGYTIKNYKELKNKYKNTSKLKITRKDINTYINLDYNLILELNNIFYLVYKVFINVNKNYIVLIHNDDTKYNFDFIDNIDNIISLFKKLNNKDNISFLKSYVTKYKIPNYDGDSVAFYQRLLEKLLNNYDKLMKLKEFDKEICKGKNISSEESKKLVDLYKNIKTNSGLYNLELNDLIEKNYNQYDIVVYIPDSPPIFDGMIGGFISRNIGNIKLEIKNPPL